MRFDPFRELDRLTERTIAQAARTMPMEALRRGDEFAVYLDVPGVSPDDVDVTRQLFLGDNLDPNGLTADLANGVLTLRIPVSEASKPRRVALASSEREGVSTERSDAPAERSDAPAGAASSSR